MKKSVTIREVARESGMSLATVSGVLNGGAGFAGKTVKHVWDVANRLHYVPSQSARRLRRGDELARRKTSIIMHIVHAGNKDAEEMFAIVSEAVYRMALLAQKRNFYSIPYTYNRLNGFRCPPLLNGYVDGTIVGTPHIEVVDAVSSKVPTVLTDVPFSTELAHVPMVNVDHRYGMFCAVKMLRELGHTSLSVFDGRDPQTGKSFSDNIMRPVFEAAEHFGLKIDPRYCMYVNITSAVHEKRMADFAELLAKGVKEAAISAVIVPHTVYTVSLKPYLMKHGIRVPGDLSIISPLLDFKPTEGASCMYLNREKLNETALDLLEELIGGKKVNSSEILVRPEYVDGGTVGKNNN